MWSFVFLFLAIIIAALAILSLIPPRYRKETVAGGLKKNSAFYLTMRDGTKIALDLWLPSNLAEGQQVPCAIRATRYVRAFEPGPLMKILYHFGVKDNLQIECEPWEKAGYAVVVVDVRGTGASFGTWVIPWADEEIADLGEVIDWIVKQPWSNGRVGAYGISYHGNTAELISINRRDALKIAAPMYSDYDSYQLVFPGGVYNEQFIKEWQQGNYALDMNKKRGPFYLQLLDKLFAVGTKPVDEDRRKALLKEVLQMHTNNCDIFEMTSKIEFRDDDLGNGYLFSHISPCGKRAKLLDEASVPMLIYAGWLDANTVDGALSRFMNANRVQQLVIGPWSHGGQAFVDPLLKEKPDHVTLFRPDHVAEWPKIFDYYCRDNSGQKLNKEIIYYTFGKGSWHRTGSWPPAGVKEKIYYFSEEAALTTNAPSCDSACESYTVDYTASTGSKTRWHTQLSGQPVFYPDRSEEDKKLLTYTSDPLQADLEITGSIIVNLYLASSHEDCAFHLYFSVVSPDGKVAYITEGILRALHHRYSNEFEDKLNRGLAQLRSYKRGDGVLLPQGQVIKIPVALYATAALVKKGNRLRISIAGHDASLFKRYPSRGTPTWEVQRNSAYPSHIVIPSVKQS